MIEKELELQKKVVQAQADLLKLQKELAAESANRLAAELKIKEEGRKNALTQAEQKIKEIKKLSSELVSLSKEFGLYLTLDIENQSLTLDSGDTYNNGWTTSSDQC